MILVIFDYLPFDSIFGWTLFWAIFFEILCFIKGLMMINDVLQTSKWKDIYVWLVMVLWLYKFRYVISWQSCIFGWMPYNIRYDFVVLSDDFDLLNRHTQNKTRRCWVYWPNVAPSQAAKWIWGFNLNAEIKRSKRFPKSWGYPNFPFF